MRLSTPFCPHTVEEWFLIGLYFSNLQWMASSHTDMLLSLRPTLKGWTIARGHNVWRHSCVAKDVLNKPSSICSRRTLPYAFRLSMRCLQTAETVLMSDIANKVLSVISDCERVDPRVAGLTSMCPLDVWVRIC
ncbi:hypothetical protein AMECASPLE_001506 [Ameca splendens]|uniref:Uncharacterized protein n=1 Tax=Ameca splendens TaxID=208324 RepID=A0ABV0ZIV7_9TELE